MRPAVRAARCRVRRQRELDLRDSARSCRSAMSICSSWMRAKPRAPTSGRLGITRTRTARPRRLTEPRDVRTPAVRALSRKRRSGGLPSRGSRLASRCARRSAGAASGSARVGERRVFGLCNRSCREQARHAPAPQQSAILGRKSWRLVASVHPEFVGRCRPETAPGFSNFPGGYNSCVAQRIKHPLIFGHPPAPRHSCRRRGLSGLPASSFPSTTIT
jgi:hypothetical protein